MSRCNILFQNNIVTNLCLKKKIKKKKQKKKKTPKLKLLCVIKFISSYLTPFCVWII